METHWEGLEYLNGYIYLTRGTTFWLVSMGSDEVNTLQSKLVFSICALHYNAQKRNDAYLISNDHMYVSKNKQCPGPIIMRSIWWNSISYIRIENIHINVIIFIKTQISLQLVITYLMYHYFLSSNWWSELVFIVMF